MKFCTHCGREIADEAVVCPGCGCTVGAAASASSTGEKKFCSHCGKELMPAAGVSPNCGCAVGNRPASGANPDTLLTSLSSKMKTNGIIWICIAAVQILLGIFVNWILLIIGGLNLFSAIGDIKYSGGVLKNPAGIIKKFEPLAGPIVVLVYNLIFGGAIGVIGSIYYLVGIRSFVLSNREASASYDPVVPNVGIGARIMSICLISDDKNNISIRNNQEGMICRSFENNFV